MRLSVGDVKARIRHAGGEVTDVGYVSCGRDTEAHVEAYWEDDYPPMAMSDAENVTVDRRWDPENAGLMFEVTV
jgi:hypothetical protein